LSARTCRFDSGHRYHSSSPLYGSVFYFLCRTEIPAAQSDDRKYGNILKQLVVENPLFEIPVIEVDGDVLVGFDEYGKRETFLA